MNAPPAHPVRSAERPASWAAVRKIVHTRDGYRCVGCGARVGADADVHHLLPRASGGLDLPMNLITLCDGCHAAFHPGLSGGLARQALERWALRLARLLDRRGEIGEGGDQLGPALRLLGATRFRDGQLDIVQAALAGKSVLVVRPTGSGKTLCFQLPAILRSAPTIVVSPLKALMAEQVSTLLRRKIPATFINSDLNADEKALRYGLLRRGAIKLLHVAPERFFVRRDEERRDLAALRPAYLVIDEAHCVDQWGRDFRPEYGRLAEIRRALGNPPVLAFTATAGVEMQKRIMASLGIEDAEVFVTGVDRPNIVLLRMRLPEAARARRIAELLNLRRGPGGKAMVFVPSTRVGHELQAELRKFGLDVPLYHSKLGRPFDREQFVKRFTDQSEPRLDVIIATSAFGMGLDVPGLRLVIHWQHPASAEDLLQELGRAGRDGATAVSIVMHDGLPGGRDVARLRFMAERSGEDGGSPDRSALESRLAQIEAVANLMRHEGCYREALLRHFGNGERRKRSLAMRILAWLFAKRSKVQDAGHCCDHCDAAEKPGSLDFVQRLLGNGAR